MARKASTKRLRLFSVTTAFLFKTPCKYLKSRGSSCKKIREMCKIFLTWDIPTNEDFSVSKFRPNCVWRTFPSTRILVKFYEKINFRKYVDFAKFLLERKRKYSLMGTRSMEFRITAQVCSWRQSKRQKYLILLWKKFCTEGPHTKTNFSFYLHDLRLWNHVFGGIDRRNRNGQKHGLQLFSRVQCSRDRCRSNRKTR